MSKWSVPVGRAVCFGNEAERVGGKGLRRGKLLRRDLGSSRHWLQGRCLTPTNAPVKAGEGGSGYCSRAEVEESVGWPEHHMKRWTGICPVCSINRCPTPSRPDSLKQNKTEKQANKQNLTGILLVAKQRRGIVLELVSA